MDVLTIIDEKLSTARIWAGKLLVLKPVSLHNKDDIPESGGVYIFHEKDGGGKSEKIYVGIAVNLKRRIHTDHLSAELKDTMSGLRKAINADRKLEFGLPMQSWFKENCTISFIEIDDPDMRNLVECLLISCLRSEKLFNKYENKR